MCLHAIDEVFNQVMSLRKAKGLALAALLLIASTAYASFDATYLQGLGDTRYERFSSETIGRDYHIYVMLPEGYGDNPEQTYPTVYLLDGGSLYPLLVGYYRYLFLGEELPAMIIVGISYGSDRFAEGNYRASDYTAPSKHREYWGDAGKFQAFLQYELLPWIEGKFRSNAKRRIVFGHSIGGQFVLYTAQTQPALFRGHIASNPALHRNLPFFLKAHWADADTVTDSFLYVGSASGDDPVFREPALGWMKHWTARDDVPWALNAATLDGHSHMSLPPAAFRDGLQWIFSKL